MRHKVHVKLPAKAKAGKGAASRGKRNSVATSSARPLARVVWHGAKGRSDARQPIIKKSNWKWLPNWIAMYAEPGHKHRCWEGHTLARVRQDGRKHRSCIYCEKKAVAGTPVLACPKGCSWTVCRACESRPRPTPTLEEDPLFYG